MCTLGIQGKRSWLALCATFGCTVMLAAQDWPRWRGVNGQGISPETGLLKKWPSDGPPLLWRVDHLGMGYSTPTIAGGKIFGMSYDGQDEIVWALAEKDGKKLWSIKIAAANKRIGYNEGSRSSPTVDENRLYVLGTSGDLVCLETASGNVVWQKNLQKDFGGRMMSGWGYSESVLIDGEKVICTPGGDAAALAALNKKNGATIWKSSISNAGGAGYASPVVAEVGGVRMYITWLGKAVVGVNAKDGKFLWRYENPAGRTANIPTAIVKDDYVFCSSGYSPGGSGLIQLIPANGGIQAKEIYYLEPNTFRNHHGGVILVGDHVYGGHGQNKGIHSCIEFKTGKIVWQENTRDINNKGSAAYLYADGHFYVRHQDGTMMLLKANPEKYDEVSRFKLPYDSGKPSWPHPVIAKGRLYIREQDVLLCFDVKDASSE